MTETELNEIVGRPLPGGTYTIERYADWLLSDVVETKGSNTAAHPLFAYLATARGMGMTWDELFAVCGATAADGPMFGEHETHLARPLVVGETLSVSGVFDSAERKSGRRTGVFDIVGFRVDLTGEGGDPAGFTRNSIVFPRRQP